MVSGTTRPLETGPVSSTRPLLVTCKTKCLEFVSGITIGIVQYQSWCKYLGGESISCYLLSLLLMLRLVLVFDVGSTVSDLGLVTCTFDDDSSTVKRNHSEWKRSKIETSHRIFSYEHRYGAKKEILSTAPYVSHVKSLGMPESYFFMRAWRSWWQTSDPNTK